LEKNGGYISSWHAFIYWKLIVLSHSYLLFAEDFPFNQCWDLELGNFLENTHVN